MSKSYTILIALLACCLGVFIGVLAMSSQVEEYKKEKRDVEVELKRVVEKAKRDLERAKEQKRASRLEQAVIKQTGDPHKRFGFQVLPFRTYFYKDFDGINLTVVGEIRNISTKALTAELQIVVRDESGRIVAVDDEYVPGGLNAVVPGGTIGFECNFLPREIYGYDPNDLTVDVTIQNAESYY